MIAFWNFGCVHYHRQGSDRFHFAILNRKVHRHRFFEFRVGPATGAECLGASQHDNPHPELLRTLHQHIDLIVGKGNDFR